VDDSSPADTPYLSDNRNFDPYPLDKNFSMPELDFYPPSISVISPTPGQRVSSSDVTVIWEGSDDASGVSNYEIRIDYGPWFNVMPSELFAHAEHTFTGLSDGAHTVDIMAYDYAGNMRQEMLSFFVNTSNLQLPAYLREVIVAVMIIAVVAVAIYVMNLKGLPKRRGAKSRLVR